MKNLQLFNLLFVAILWVAGGSLIVFKILKKKGKAGNLFSPKTIYNIGLKGFIILIVYLLVVAIYLISSMKLINYLS